MQDNIQLRPFTEHTRWIICMWHIRGFSADNIAKDLRRSLRVVAETIAQAKEDGYYNRAKDYIEYFDMKVARDWAERH